MTRYRPGDIVLIRFPWTDLRSELEIHTTLKQPDEWLRWYSYLFWFKANRVADLQRGNAWGQVNPPHRPQQQP
jgi:hypothetical protein